jgi:ABC-type glycerol-3-phosphate transport system permease component
MLGDNYKLMALAVLFLAPFLWIIITTLKTEAQIAAFPVQLWPSLPDWHNFVQALTMINFPAYAANSVMLATINASLTTISSALVGFGFARLKGWGKRPLFLCAGLSPQA